MRYLYIGLRREALLHDPSLQSCVTNQLCALRRADRLVGHADSRVLGTTMNQRRYTYNKDVLWILDHLSQHGKILKLKLGFRGRRNVRMSIRDKDFLVALKGVKTDNLVIGNPRVEGTNVYEVRFSLAMMPLSTWNPFELGSVVQSKLTSIILIENQKWQIGSGG